MIDMDALVDELAAELGVAPATRKKWRQRGSVPHRMRDDLRERAMERGVAIPRSVFDAFGRAPDKSAAA